MILILMCVFCSLVKTTSAEKHTLQYLYTLRSAPADDPEFDITTVFDGLILSHCKSPRLVDQSRQDWIHQAFTTAEWKSRDSFCVSEYYYHKTLKKKIEDVINTTNGIIQRERSCTTDDSVIHMSDRWGVNGEDFFTLDPSTLKWSADSPLAKTIQSDWNQMKFMTPSLKDFELNQCEPSLMKLKKKKAEYLRQNQLPEVYIFGKPSHDGDAVSLRCYIIHKYLPGVRVRLTLDGVVLDKVNISSAAPNMDGSIQIRLETETSIKEPDRYQCMVDTDNVHTSTKWDGQTLTRAHVSHEHGWIAIAWIPFILLLVIVGTAWIMSGVLQSCSIICNKAWSCFTVQVQVNTNISNEVNFMLYVQTEEEFRNEAKVEDEFYGPTRPRVHSV